jgi:hypothetical protein
MRIFEEFLIFRNQASLVITDGSRNYLVGWTAVKRRGSASHFSSVPKEFPFSFKMLPARLWEELDTSVYGMTFTKDRLRFVTFMGVLGRATQSMIFRQIFLN